VSAPASDTAAIEIAASDPSNRTAIEFVFLLIMTVLIMTLLRTVSDRPRED
jgi:hypothetical protein